MNSLRGGSPMIGLQHAPRFGGVSCIAVPSLTSLATCGVERSGFLIACRERVLSSPGRGRGWTCRLGEPVAGGA